MPHSGKTSKGMSYRSTKAHPKPKRIGGMVLRPTTGTTGPSTKPAAAGSRTAPSSKASPMAMERSHGQRGAAMKEMHTKSGGEAMPMPLPKVKPMSKARVPSVPGARGKRKVK